MNLTRKEERRKLLEIAEAAREVFRPMTNRFDSPKADKWVLMRLQHAVLRLDNGATLSDVRVGADGEIYHEGYI